MVKFYWSNSYMKHKSRTFSWAAIPLCILSVHVLLCSARPNVENTSVEKTAESDADEVKTENRQSTADMMFEKKEKHTENDAEDQKPDTSNNDNIEENEENSEEDDYIDEYTGPVKRFTEPKTSPLPTQPTPRPHAYSEDDEDEKDISENDEVTSETETMPTPSASTRTTEEPTPRIVGILREDEDNYTTPNSSQPERIVEDIPTMKITKLVPNKGSTLNNYNFVLFVSVLFYLFAYVGIL